MKDIITLKIREITNISNLKICPCPNKKFPNFSISYHKSIFIDFLKMTTFRQVRYIFLAFISHFTQRPASYFFYKRNRKNQFFISFT